MRTTTEHESLDRLLKVLSDFLTPESAQRLVKLKVDPRLQARVDELAEKCSEGSLSQDERDEYSRHVTYGTIISILQSKARRLLAQSGKG